MTDHPHSPSAQEDEVARLIDSAFESESEGQWRLDPHPVDRLTTLLEFTQRRLETHNAMVAKRLRAFNLDALRSSRAVRTQVVPWQTAISIGAESPPPLERLVEALNDPRWEFRTVEGLAEDLGVEPAAVEAKLDAFPEVARWLPATDDQGRKLLVAARRTPTWKERLLRARAYAAKLS
jgi:hypothetical protein